MGWLKKIPKISLLLLIATYGVFGWLYSSWIAGLATKTELWYQWFQPSIAVIISYGLGLISIVVVIKFFTAPMALLTLGMDNWFRADAKAAFAIAISILLFALVIEYPAVLTRFLILSSAAMLFRLDLQTVGCSYKVSQLILICLSLTSFVVGIVVFKVS